MAIKSKGTTGTTYKELQGMYLLDAGDGTSVSHFDVAYGVNNLNDNYKVYKIFLRDIDVNGYQLHMTHLSSANTPATTGHYGGGMYLGEGITTGTSEAWSNQNHHPLSLGESAASLSGAYTANMEITIYQNITQGSGRMTCNWNGMFRTSGGSTIGLWGGGTTTGDGDYGVRIRTNDANNQRIIHYTYAMYGLGGFTQ